MGAERARRRLPLLGAASRDPDGSPLLPVREVDRLARPRYVVWEITLRCDLACKHCGSRAGKSRPNELDTREALDVVAELAEMGAEEITLIGGEAYLRDDWLEIAGAIAARGITCGIVTGGKGMTPERVRAAKEAGVSAVSVSVDGLEASHDAVRGKGSFLAALGALEALAEAGVRRAVNTSVNRRNLREMQGLLERLLPTGLYAWQVQFTVPMGRAADRPELLIEPYQMLELMPLVARLERRARSAGVRLWPANNIGYFGPYERLLRGELRLGHGESCAAGREVLGLEADGTVKGCPSLPTADYAGGNVRERTLREIWEGTAEMRFTRAREKSELWGFCASCYYAEDCLAGCSWTTHVLFGRRGNNPYCHHRSLELLARGERERLVRVEAPPGEPFDRGLFELVLERWPEAELEEARALARSGEGFLSGQEPAFGIPSDRGGPR